METGFDNTGQVIDQLGEESSPKFHEPTENEKELLSFVVSHTDKWREHRDQNYRDEWDKYERIFRGKWAEEDKHRQSERSRIISPATQQAVETRHAEIMEAVFGQGEFFDIKDDLKDENGNALDVEILKNQLNEDFSQDKIRKSFDQVALLGEIYGTGIAEIIVSEEKQYKPMRVPIDGAQVAYGVGEETRVSVKLNPVNPKNFLFDPNGTSIDDCLGVAIEKPVGIHKIIQGITSGRYLNVDISSCYENDDLEVTQEKASFKDDRVTLLTYYGLVPREYLQTEEFAEVIEKDDLVSEENEDYADMVEAIVVIANGSILLKAEENPYMMKDRPVLAYQADTVPNRLMGRGTVEKAFNMQAAIDGSARSHMDALALTVAPMIGIDATRLPRGAKFEVKPGKALLTNGNPSEIMMPFSFGNNDGAAMDTAKEFERQLLMATGTVDSAGQVSQVARDTNMDMATATLIKKYKRVLTNIQEDFIVPFVYKAAWRYMQFAPERYPAVDVKFIPTASLGIVAREYEQKQLAFLIQTLGANSPLTPVLMTGILKNSSLSNREQMIAQMSQANQPNPEQAQMMQMGQMLEMRNKAADTQKKEAEAKKATVEAETAPLEAKAKVLSALSNNLNEDNESKDFERRAKIAELMLKEKDINLREKDIDSNERIAVLQTEAQKAKKQSEESYLNQAAGM